MVTVETITEKVRMLPISSQHEVFEFVEDLLERSAKPDVFEKAAAWEKWANSHSDNATVVDDSREAIYDNE
jgi:hypothetical protein